MKMLPTKQQWRRWSLPSKMTCISFVIAVLTVICYFSDKYIDNKQHKELMAEIKKNHSPDDSEVSEELKIKVKTAAEQLSNPKTADDWYLKGYAAQMDKNYDKAIEHYEKSNSIESHAETYNNIGNCYFDKKDYNTAIKYYLTAIACYAKAVELKLIESNNEQIPSYSTNIGVAYRKKQDYENAIIFLHGAIALNPDYGRAYGNLGNVYADKQNYDSAMIYYKKTIELNPNYAEPYNNIGCVYLNKGIYGQEKFIDSVKMYFKNTKTKVYSVSGYLPFEKDYDSAIGYFEKAIELNPDYTDAYFNLGQVYLNQQNYDEAIENYEKAIKLKSDKLIEIYHCMLKVYIETQNEDKAIKCTQALARLGNEEAKQVLKDNNYDW
ncbi:MAG: tetratricopeptide repeat protein [Bacteroidales bacterium]|nr:tetratricopeptide repeat protein [Bacteroidales bacterium]